MSIKLVLTVLFVNTLAACAAPRLPGDLGTRIPAYAAVSPAGDSVVLAEQVGHPVLLNVWATWCSPCKKEIPEIEALHQKYSAVGFHVIGVNIDDARDSADVTAFVRDYGMTYTIALDPANHVSKAFRFQGVPGSVLIDSKGIVRWRHLGRFSTTDSDFQDALQKMLSSRI